MQHLQKNPRSVISVKYWMFIKIIIQYDLNRNTHYYQLWNFSNFSPCTLECDSLLRVCYTDHAINGCHLYHRKCAMGIYQLQIGGVQIKSLRTVIQCLGIISYPLSVQKLLHLPGTKIGSLDAVFSDFDNFTAASKKLDSCFLGFLGL